jgi:succinyl-CoA synthetase alpha subunit
MAIHHGKFPVVVFFWGCFPGKAGRKAMATATITVMMPKVQAIQAT